MTFVIVGSVAPFDRLIRAADALAAEYPHEHWFAQIGDGAYLPTNMEYVRFMAKPEFDLRLAGSDKLIGHAGMGTISTALGLGKPLLVMPRDPERGEHVDDHQIATAEYFAGAGHVLAAAEAHELGSAYLELSTFDPVPRTPTPAKVAQRIGQFLSTFESRRSTTRQ